MGWESRARGGLYYYQSRREGGRVVKDYIGTGRVAELAARLDQVEQDKRAQERAEWSVERRRIREADRALQQLCEATDVLAATALLLSGCHQHKRQWRRRRDNRNNG